MNISTDYYAHKNNLNGLPPQLKILWGVLTMIISLVSPSPIIPFLVAFLMSFMTVYAAGVPPRYYLKFIGIPLAFGFITFIFMAFFFGVKPAINTGILGLKIYGDGLHSGLLVFSKITGGFTCLAFLSLTTPPNEMFKQLERVKIPRFIVEIALLMYRSIFILIEEASRMYHAQETRLGYNTLKGAYKSLGLLTSNLFIRSWIKGERIYQAMEARCYQGEIPTMGIQETDNRWTMMIIVFEISLLIGVYLTRNIKIL